MEKCHVLHHFKLYLSFVAALGLIRDIFYFSYVQDAKNYPERIALPYRAGTMVLLFKAEFSASSTELGTQRALDKLHWMDKWMLEWMHERQDHPLLWGYSHLKYDGRHSL